MKDCGAIAAVGIHLENAIFLFGEQLAVVRPAKPACGRTAADGHRLSSALAIVGSGLQRAEILGLHGGNGLAVGGETDDGIRVRIVGDRAVLALRVRNHADLRAIEIRLAPAGDDQDAALIGQPHG